MNHIFNFNSRTHNFWPIYNTITKFYPIGLRRDENSILFDYPGIKELENIIVDVIHNKNDFYQLWLKFRDELSKKLDKVSQGTTMGQAPSLSVDVFLEKTKTKSFISNKKLCINISLAGKFYTIYGIDDSASLDLQEGQLIRHYYAVNAITVSPYKEFEQPIKAAQELIEQFYPDYLFIPFSVHSMIVNGLKVRYSDKEVCSVYDALFNGNLDYSSNKTFRRGDVRYGYDEHWKIDKPGNRDFPISLSSPPII